jgi:AAA ATPase domain
LKKLAQRNYLKNKNTCLINTFRKIEFSQGMDKNSYDYKLKTYNGIDLISRLNELKNPRAENQKEKQKFINIENFLKDILNEKNLSIELSSEEGPWKELSLKIRELQIPLDNLGTGIQQLIILAASVMVLENYIICIEEPEIFIHPELQRRFIKYLLSTKNQYFIATHSNTFINIEGVDVYHIMHDGSKSIAKKVISSNEKNLLLDDLGYQASDILQSNYLIWVEGPSDKIYLNYWIKSLNDNLIEGIHYSIMFYGGKLLSHISADENAFKDFIKLNKINRNIGIVVDSDKKTSTDSINETKQRIVREFKKNRFFMWITKGKEIENYISKTDLANAIKLINKNQNIKIDYGPYKSLTKCKINGKLKILDKINLARKVTELKLDMDILDLKDKLVELIDKINKANKL